MNRDSLKIFIIVNLCFIGLLIAGDMQPTPLVYTGGQAGVILFTLMAIVVVIENLLQRKNWSDEDRSEHNRCEALMTMGKYEESLQACKELLRKIPKARDGYSLVLNSVACNYAFMGRIDEALETWATAEEHLKSRMDRNPSWYFMINCNLAEAWAVKGRVDQSRKHFAIAQTMRMNKSNALVAELMILSREKAWGEVVQRAQTNWDSVQRLYCGLQLKSVKLFWAFALSQLPHSNKKSELTNLLLGFYPVTAGEFDYLAVNWPELKTFLKEHHLSATDAAA